jgi:hypothetical protein
MHLHKTLVWWSLWGLAVGVGLFGLQEAHTHSIHLVLAIPILSGAIAAAFMRLKHEYHEAMLHAKWVVVSGSLLLLSTGYAYVKTEAYGPFATASAHKAFLGTRFEMSVPEVERTVGRRLAGPGSEPAQAEGLKDWILEALPLFERPTMTRSLSNLIVYHVPCTANFGFVRGKLARVEVQFEPTSTSESRLLLQRIQEDLQAEYARVDAPANLPANSLMYRKEAVDTMIIPTFEDAKHHQISVVLQYLPFADEKRGPLKVEAKAF